MARQPLPDGATNRPVTFSLPLSAPRGTMAGGKGRGDVRDSRTQRTTTAPSHRFAMGHALSAVDGREGERGRHQSTLLSVRPSLIAFDVDGTLLRGPSICACVAAGIGREREMAALEYGHSIADIAYARATMAVWYSSVGIDALLGYLRTVRLAPGAREGIALLRAAGVKVALVSLSWQFALDWLLRELSADYAAGASFATDGTVRHFWPKDKARWLRARARALGLTRADVVAVGDSPTDLPMLRFAASGYYVGCDPLPGLPAQVRHRPATDIAVLAREVLTPTKPR